MAYDLEERRKYKAYLVQARLDLDRFAEVTEITLDPKQRRPCWRWVLGKRCLMGYPSGRDHLCGYAGITSRIWDHPRRATMPDGRRAIVLATYDSPDAHIEDWEQFTTWCEGRGLMWRHLKVAHHNADGCLGIAVTARS